MTTEKWHQIWIWFEVSVKEFKVQIEIFAFVFDWIFKQQLNLLLILSDWYCRKLGLTDLPGHDGKLISHKKIISISHQGYKDGNRDYCSHFSVTFETRGKFLIFFFKNDIGKSGGWRIYRATTGKWHHIWIRFEGSIKRFGVQVEILASVFDWISKQQLHLPLFL